MPEREPTGMPSGLRCCVVTPIGPGHAQRYAECRASVLAAYRHDPGPFTDLVFAAMDDSEGQHGRSRRRNDGIREAARRGADWIFFLDADDLMAESAFTVLGRYHEQYDAVWGAILETAPGRESGLRPRQVMPITSLLTVLDNDPMLTLQMGHFVRTTIAADIRFDTRLDAGEDFRYYLQLWRDHRCIKLDVPLFLNRRGIHSSGPRAADGRTWTENVANVLLDFRIANADLIERLYRDAAPAGSGRHIVVAGFSRSGTTMFYNMLRRAVRNFDFLDQEYPAARIIGGEHRALITKRPLDIFDAANIRTANTRHKSLDFIVLLRDIRAILTSRHRAVPDDYFIGHDFQYFLPPDDAPPARTLPGILPTYQAIVHLLRTPSPGKKIIVRYEDLVTDTARVQSYLAKSLHLSYRDRFENFHHADIPERLSGPLNRVAAPDAARIDRWKLPEHRERIRSQFNTCPALFDILVQTGYEKDRAWFEAYR